MTDSGPVSGETPPTRVEVLGGIGPNWFASVMGTGIVANAGASHLEDQMMLETIAKSRHPCRQVRWEEVAEALQPGVTRSQPA